MVAAHMLVGKGEEGEACLSLLLQQLLELSLAVEQHDNREEQRLCWVAGALPTKVHAPWVSEGA